MPLTLWEFLLTIPLTVGVFMAPFILFALWKRRKLNDILIAWFGISAVFMLFFLCASLLEQV